MVYMGSKAAIAGSIVPILQKIIDDNNIVNFYDVMCGGCNIIDKIICENRYANDKSESLIRLLKLAQTNPKKIPESITREMFVAARAHRRFHDPLLDYMDADIAAACEWLGSYSARGFAGGFANPFHNGERDPYKEHRKNLVEQGPKLKGIIFSNMNYDELNIPDGSLIYCDPPYLGTKKYGYVSETAFDYDKYYDWVRKMSETCFVVCSEQHMPDDFKVIWQCEKRRTIKKENDVFATEKLYVCT